MLNTELPCPEVGAKTLLNPMDVDLATISSPTLARIIEEVRNAEASTTRAFDRVHNRHNR
jgi:hypothetical protein